MVVTELELPKKVHLGLAWKKRVSYEDVIHYYESTFEYESVWMDAWEFKKYLKEQLWSKNT
jgi:hypothetical protein